MTLLSSNMLGGMSKWHLEKHSVWGSCSAYAMGGVAGILCVSDKAMSTVAFCWHGKVTGHKRMPVDVQPELVNIYLQACCCHSWTCTYFFWASLSSCGKDNWEIVKPVVRVLDLEWYDLIVDIYIHAWSISTFCLEMSLLTCLQFPCMIIYNHARVSHIPSTFGNTESLFQ